MSQTIMPAPTDPVPPAATAAQNHEDYPITPLHWAFIIGSCLAGGLVLYFLVVGAGKETPWPSGKSQREIALAVWAVGFPGVYAIEERIFAAKHTPKQLAKFAHAQSTGRIIASFVYGIVIAMTTGEITAAKT